MSDYDGGGYGGRVLYGTFYDRDMRKHGMAKGMGVSWGLDGLVDRGR